MSASPDKGIDLDLPNGAGRGTFLILDSTSLQWQDIRG